MSETTDVVVPSGRRADDTLMGVFGIPDTGNTINISFSGTSAASTSFKKQKWYRFVSTQDCYVHFHASAAATSSHMLLKAGVPEVFYTGVNTRVAAIQSSASGTLIATPLQTDTNQ